MNKAFLISMLFVLMTIHLLHAQDFWEEVILPDSIENIFSVNFNSQNRGFFCTEEGVYYTDDNGESWNYLAGFISKTVEISSSDEIYLGLDSEARLLYSNTNGNTWDTIQTDFTFGGHIRLINDTILFAFDWHWISKSTNCGYTWNQVYFTPSSEIFIDLIIKQNTLYAGSINYISPYGGGVYHSLDFGNSWQQISLAGYGISSFEIDINNALLCGVNFQYSYQGFGVFRSIDEGYTWTNILDNHFVTSLVVDQNGGIYAGCDSDFGPWGILFSSDNGLTWNPINEGLHDQAFITSLTFSPEEYIYTTTIHPFRLYRSINPIVEISELRSPEAILQLFPNPCQDVVNIRIESHSLWDKNQDYLIEIFNSLGEIVRRENMNPYENHVISFDISTLSRGLYFVRIHSGMKIQGGRFIKY